MSGVDSLADYRATGSEPAFGAVVRRYTSLVYSAAWRRLGNETLAEDVTQTVFTRLAATAPRLGTEAELAAWLHRTTVHVAIDVWRSETRRRTREQKAVTMQTDQTEPAENSLWHALAPVLDEALDRLGPADRQALLARYFDDKPMREVGKELGVSEDAAKMRVSRAIEKLRTQIGNRGVACSVAVLGALLAERSVMAVPQTLAAKLSRLQLPALTGGAGIGGVLGLLWQASRPRLAAGAAILLLGGIATVWYFRSHDNPGGQPQVNTVVANTETPPPATPREVVGFSRRSGAVPNAVPNVVLPNTKLLLRVIDAVSGDGLADTKVKTAYFGIGGLGESSEVRTDVAGVAAIPEPGDPQKDNGMNVFVTADGHVPMCVRFVEKKDIKEYTLKLAPALAAGGRVVDDHDQPVAGVKIQLQGSGSSLETNENVDFQTSFVNSDADGRWYYPYVPREMRELRFILTHENFAVTLPVLLAAKYDLTKLVFVMNRGFAIEGTLTDASGQPVAGARVREVSNTGYRRLATTTDEQGNYRLRGADGYDQHLSPAPEPNRFGELVVKGMVGTGEARFELVIQAEGFTPEVKTVPLPNPTNIANFTLASGRIFRGRVLDESGNPIADVVVQTDSDNQGRRNYQWNTRTDADGRFEWKSAPKESQLFWFEARGYEVLRDIPITPDGTDHDITLKRPRSRQTAIR